MTQETKNALLKKVEQVRITAVQKLGRQEGSRLTNSALNEILGTYKDMDIRNLDDINDNLKGIKPAKSIGGLVYNIKKQLPAGKRSDRTVLDLNDLF